MSQESPSSISECASPDPPKDSLLFKKPSKIPSHKQSVPIWSQSGAPNQKPYLWLLKHQGFCQAQHQLNSTQLKLRLRLALFPPRSRHPLSHPATHPEQKITHDCFKIIQDYLEDAFRLIQDYFKTTLTQVQPPPPTPNRR